MNSSTNDRIDAKPPADAGNADGIRLKAVEIADLVQRHMHLETVGGVRSLAREPGPAIRVNAVVPGICRTEIWEKTGLTREQIDARLLEFGAMVPAGRDGEPEEVARWICMLLDRSRSCVTGGIVAVDGGFTA